MPAYTYIYIYIYTLHISSYSGWIWISIPWKENRPTPGTSSPPSPLSEEPTSDSSSSLASAEVGWAGRKQRCNAKEWRGNDPHSDFFELSCQIWPNSYIIQIHSSKQWDDSWIYVKHGKSQNYSMLRHQSILRHQGFSPERSLRGVTVTGMLENGW